ncbi:8395_t:CDS:10 [Paraglomus brasilianum]|uniref:8395_t:CDS:1 n=1 Tax=Paraglomus brasilianum TaxID=144538 RepID=A0A9N8Z484_9GLOM|nr:8395_t:CDS:10 [Paraglomus brasilianum]
MTSETSGDANEEEKIQAMFQQSSEFWEKTQELMAAAPFRRYNQGRPHGHWIQNCPTNGDKSFDHMKVRRTTGIPKSFLQKVEQVPAGKGVLVTQDGNLVIAQANDAAWQKFHAKQKAYVTSNEVLEETAPIPEELKCHMCSGLLKEASMTPCCKASYCDECIRNALITPQQEYHFKCPSCGAHLVPDNLLPDKRSRAAVEEHLREWARRLNEIAIAKNASDVEGAEKEKEIIDSIDRTQTDEDKDITEQKIELEDKDVATPAKSEISEQQVQSEQSDQASQPSSQQSQIQRQTQNKEKSSQAQSHSQQAQQQQQSGNKQFSGNNTGSGFNQFGYYDDYNGFGFDQGQGYWYDDSGYPVAMNMLNNPYHDPSNYFDSTAFYPPEPFIHPQFVTPFRPIYDEYWDGPMPPPGAFRGSFPARGMAGRGRARGRGGFFDRGFGAGRGGNASGGMGGSGAGIEGRRSASPMGRSSPHDNDSKYDKERIQDDFHRSQRRNPSFSHGSNDKDSVRDRASPTPVSERSRRDRESRRGDSSDEEDNDNVSIRSGHSSRRSLQNDASNITTSPLSTSHDISAPQSPTKSHRSRDRHHRRHHRHRSHRDESRKSTRDSNKEGGSRHRSRSEHRDDKDRHDRERSSSHRRRHHSSRKSSGASGEDTRRQKFQENKVLNESKVVKTK